jgi:DMSO/TMAO reductase YedYZ heme-binding membrane subunit
MTIILITSTVFVILALLFYKQIHQFKAILYVVAAFIALASHEEANIVSLGYVTFGIFLVVMFSGALSKGLIRKRLFMVRAEYAVIGTILLLPHGLGYIGYYLDEVPLSSATLTFYIGIVALLVAIPLFITSFQYIRKKMNYKSWKRLHLAAYLFYLVVFIHLLLMNNDRFFMYLAIGVFYIILKSKDWYTMIKKARMKKQNV